MSMLGTISTKTISESQTGSFTFMTISTAIRASHSKDGKMLLTRAGVSIKGGYWRFTTTYGLLLLSVKRLFIREGRDVFVVTAAYSTFSSMQPLMKNVEMPARIKF